MRIQSIDKTPYSLKTSFQTQKKVANNYSEDHVKKNKKDKNLSNYLIPAGIVLSAVVGGYYIKKLNSTNKIVRSETTEKYIEELSKSLSKWLNKDIKAKDLESVMSGEELLIELKNLKKENFVASAENIKNGTFIADLHSHSLYSDGAGKVDEILDNVVTYADNLNKKNGKKFIFSLTDHDNSDGVKEALKIIAENPKKFKNVKFVVGSELSYLIKSNKTANPYETSELLVYGFNPFDSNIENYFNSLFLKRKNMVSNYINDLNNMFGYAEYSIEEFNNIYGKNYMMNYQWEVHHYGQTKNAISGLAQEQGKNKSDLYKEIMSKTEKNKKTLHDLREKGLVPQNYGDDTRITDICKDKYTPKDNGKIIDFVAEANIDDIIKTFSADKNTFGAFAHPYYMNERNSETLNLINKIVNKSNGFIKATESHHQAYKSNFDINEIDKYNSKIVEKNLLLELGGRDNHKSTWLD